LFWFWRWMFWTVIKAKIGNRTTTAPINIHGGTPAQNLLCLILFGITLRTNANLMPLSIFPNLPLLDTGFFRGGSVPESGFNVQGLLQIETAQHIDQNTKCLPQPIGWYGFESTMGPQPIDGSCLKFFQPGRTARPGLLIQKPGSIWILFTHRGPFSGESGYLVSTIWFPMARKKEGYGHWKSSISGIKGRMASSSLGMMGRQSTS